MRDAGSVAVAFINVFCLGVARGMFGDLDEGALRTKLVELKREHRALDDEVRALQEFGVLDQLKIMRLKRRKLQLKDQIFAIEDALNPDIIA
jgi:hypothetical protein